MLSFEPLYALVAKLVLEIQETPLQVHRGALRGFFELRPLIYINYSLCISIDGANEKLF